MYCVAIFATVLTLASFSKAQIPYLPGPSLCVAPQNSNQLTSTDICGQTGALQNPDPLKSVIHTRGHFECAQRCFGGDNPKCKSFAFTPPHMKRGRVVYKNCQLYKNTLSAMGYSGNGTDTIGTLYSSSGCYTATPMPSPIVKDGDFEEDLPSGSSAGWKTFSIPSGSTDLYYDLSGNHVGEIVDAPRYEVEQVRIYQLVDTCLHTFYQLRYSVGGTNTGLSQLFTYGSREVIAYEDGFLGALEEKVVYLVSKSKVTKIEFDGSQFEGREQGPAHIKQYIDNVELLPVYRSRVPANETIYYV